MCCGLFLFQIPLPTSLYVRQIPVELIFLCLAMSDLKSYVDVWWFWFVCLMPVLGTSSFSCVFKILISFPSPLQRYIVCPLKFTEIFLIFKIFLSFDSTVHIFSNISYTYLKEILLNAICGVEFFLSTLGRIQKVFAQPWWAARKATYDKIYCITFGKIKKIVWNIRFLFNSHLQANWLLTVEVL